MYNYADSNIASVTRKELTFLGWQLQAEAEVTVQWFSDNAMKADSTKFRGVLLEGNTQASEFRVSVQGREIDFSKLIVALCLIVMTLSHLMIT